ncbi:MAG: hypothetical protein PHD15_06785 [Clostridia bacterium]|nr:hypothetical protein [Clostridia bacterium]MDD4387434.1 hypothetical protein [Clostridia bacterium]
MKVKKYELPKVLSKFSCTEPVETGCCLRSCGGSPHHLGTNKINIGVKQSLENAIK